MKLKDILNEKITIDVEVGDTILTGRFKNKKTKVNSIETDQHGMPTINGRKVTTFRTMKKQDESTAAYKKTLQKILKDKQLKMLSKKDKETLLKIAKMMKEAVVKVSKKDDVPGNVMKMKGEEKIKKLVYSGSNGKGSYEIKGNKLNVIGIRPRDKGFFVRHFTMGTGIRKANLYYDGVHWQGGKKFESVNEAMSDSEIKKMMKEGPQRDRNNMALYIIDLNKELSNAKVLAKKHPKYKKYVKFIQQDIKDAEKKLSNIKEDFDAVPAKWSSKEAKQMMDVDVKKMSMILGKASYKIIKMMMDGVKGGKYDALDIIRGIETGALNRTHEGERPFMKMLWRKVRKEFRRYSKKGKLRKENEIGEAKERDYKDEYKKFQSSKKAKKYRAELNQYNRKKGTYGNGDGKDASHKGGKIVGFESQSKNRGRREKSRLKKK